MVPILIVLALVLVVAQPRLSRRFVSDGQRVTGATRCCLWLVVLPTGVYGGYFGAAQGVLLIALLGALSINLQRVNGLKNALSSLVNLIAGLLFIIFAHPDWIYVAIIAVFSAIGGQLGAVVGRRLAPIALRVVIVVVGCAALTKFLFFS